MDLDARPLRCFLAVAETLSFARAARQLNVSQPALSATIKELERRLGFKLFDRGTRSVALTNEGKLFLGNARRYVRESAILQQGADAIRSNEVRISSAFHTALIPERNALLERFFSHYPSASVHILNDDHRRGQARLISSQADLLIALAPSTTDDGGGQSQMGSDTPIERKVLASRLIGLLIPKDHPLVSSPSLELADLTGVEVVVPGRFHGVEISEHIRFALETAGAKTVRSPEGNDLGVSSFAAATNRCAVSLGWFAQTANNTQMVTRVLPQLGSTSLCLMRRSGDLRAAAARLWDLVDGPW